jgi:drug/metabolite transporter (DMT)-like permease
VPTRKAGLVVVGLGGLVISGLGISSFGGRQGVGHLLFLSAACLLACYTVAIRHARLDGLHAAAIAAVVSLLVYFPFYLTFMNNGLLEARLTDLVYQALYQGVVMAAVSFALYGRSIMLLGASGAAAFIALAPVMAALMAIPVLNEWPTSIDWLAIGTITAGVYLASGAPVPVDGQTPPVTGRINLGLDATQKVRHAGRNGRRAGSVTKKAPIKSACLEKMYETGPLHASDAAQ